MSAPVQRSQHTASYYAASSLPQPDHPVLQGELVADVCVVGGGFSGLNTALELAERGMSVVAVIHDLNLAARFADQIVVLKDGEIIARGKPKDVITPNNLAAAFNILARVIEDPVGKTPMVVPIRQLG